MGQSLMMDIVQMDGREGEPVQNTFTLIGFGENEDAQIGKEQNKMKEVQLYRSATDDTPLSVLPLPADMQSFAGQGANERVQLKYNPIGTLAYNDYAGTAGPTYKLVSVNILDAMKAAMPTYDMFGYLIDEFFKNSKSKPFGTGLDNFTIQIMLPDLDNENALKVEPEWTLR